MKLHVQLGTVEFSFPLMRNIDHMQEEIQISIAKHPDPVSAAIAFGLAWGIFLHNFRDEENPLQLTSQWKDIRCIILLSDPDLESFFGVSRQ